MGAGSFEVLAMLLKAARISRPTLELVSGLGAGAGFESVKTSRIAS
jgi:hypothetical protein